MLKSIRDVIIKADAAYPKTKRNAWVTQWPGQVSAYVRARTCVFTFVLFLWVEAQAL